MIDSLATMLLLLGLELVLSVDNVLVIAIFVGRLPKFQRNRARVLGLTSALVARIVMLVLVLNLTNVTRELLFNLSIRDMILLGGGLFLLTKAVKEIHRTVELKEELQAHKMKQQADYLSIIGQIVVLDVVFSIDSVITAVGLTNQLWVIISAVILAFIGILLFAKSIGEFIIVHPALKILALSFLITIGVTIFMEGMHTHVPKAYIYLPMGFALVVELLQMRYERNRQQIHQQGNESKSGSG